MRVITLINEQDNKNSNNARGTGGRQNDNNGDDTGEEEEINEFDNTIQVFTSDDEDLILKWVCVINNLIC